MNNKFLVFDVPPLYNPYDRDEILCNLEALAIAAIHLATDEQRDLRETLEFESATVKNDSAGVYERSYDELIEIVGGYNYFISKNMVNEPSIQIVIDDAKTKLLNKENSYPIYKIILE